MKRIVTILALGVLAFPLGCDRGTSGGPAASNPPSSPGITGQDEDTFSLSVPSVSINQGETENATIDINRGDNFGQNVAVNLGTLPEGITLSPSNPSIKHGDAEVELAITAARDAALGTFTIEVTGQPDTGTAAMAEMEITVDEYDAESVSREADAEDREAWQESIRTQEMEVAALTEAHDSLVEQADNATGEAKADLEMQIERTKARLDIATAELDEQKSTAPSAWVRLKDSVSTALDN